MQGRNNITINIALHAFISDPRSIKVELNFYPFSWEEKNLFTCAMPLLYLLCD
jgi:hypothetical protein